MKSPVVLAACTSNCFFFFCFSMESSHFGCHFSMFPSTKPFSSIFDLGPLMPKICTKSPISWLVWQIDRRCLSLLGGFWGWPIQWNHAKCCGADPCYHGIGIWARRGDPVAQRLVAFIYVFVRNKRNERERLRHYRNL